MIRSAIGIVTLLSLAATPLPALETFTSGQIWTYEARATEPESRIVILRVEEYPKPGRIVHVAVVGLQRRMPDGTLETWRIGPAPFTEAALRKSVLKLESGKAAVSMADFEEFYTHWRKMADRGKVQHWSSPVPDAIRRMEKQMFKGPK